MTRHWWLDQSVLFLALLIFTPLVFAEGDSKAIKSKQEELKEIEHELQSKKEKISSLLEKENSIVSMLDTLDRDIAARKTRRNKLRKERDEKKQTIKTNQLRIGSLERKLDVHKLAVADRLRLLYRLGDFGYLKILLGAQDLRDFSQWAVILRRVVEEDSGHLRTYRESKSELEDINANLVREQAKLDRLVAEIQEEQESISNRRTRQKRLLRLTRTQKDIHEKSIRELEEAQEKLSSLIQSLTSKGYASNFRQTKGTLLFPVKGSLIGKYGAYTDPKFKTRIFRNGIQVKASYGDPVLSIYPGKVIYAGWFRGYGKIVVVDHGDDYFSLNAHLSELAVEVGDTVKENTEIGKVGDTGSLHGSILYFELRHRGKAIDPLGWFNPLSKQSRLK